VVDGQIWSALINGQIVQLDATNGQVVARFGDTQSSIEKYQVAQAPLVSDGMVMYPLGWYLMGLENK
jgi:hypothetical protein